jgi:hypothetical protein
MTRNSSAPATQMRRMIVVISHEAFIYPPSCDAQF